MSDFYDDADRRYDQMIDARLDRQAERAAETQRGVARTVEALEEVAQGIEKNHIPMRALDFSRSRRAGRCDMCGVSTNNATAWVWRCGDCVRITLD